MSDVNIVATQQGDEYMHAVDDSSAAPNKSINPFLQAAQQQQTEENDASSTNDDEESPDDKFTAEELERMDSMSTKVYFDEPLKRLSDSAHAHFASFVRSNVGIPNARLNLLIDAITHNDACRELIEADSGSNTAGFPARSTASIIFNKEDGNAFEQLFRVTRFFAHAYDIFETLRAMITEYSPESEHCTYVRFKTGNTRTASDYLLADSEFRSNILDDPDFAFWFRFNEFITSAVFGMHTVESFVVSQAIGIDQFNYAKRVAEHILSTRLKKKVTLSASDFSGVKVNLLSLAALCMPSSLILTIQQFFVYFIMEELVDPLAILECSDSDDSQPAAHSVFTRRPFFGSAALSTASIGSTIFTLREIILSRSIVCAELNDGDFFARRRLVMNSIQLGGMDFSSGTPLAPLREYFLGERAQPCNWSSAEECSQQPTQGQEDVT